MLSLLFGNKSVEKILFFLLINGKCYAGKLSRHFRTPLTPLQQGLIKLEEMGILESYLEGKIRYFHFNRACPYLAEFEAFLRKTYTLLPAVEKQEYYDPDIKIKKVSIGAALKRDEQPIFSIWDKLARIQKLTFSANSQGTGCSGWNGIGHGSVQAKRLSDTTLLFYESGTWVSREGNENAFKNVFRWTLDRFQQLITLEHLRFGENHPVFLFQLAQIDRTTLESVSSYICLEDTYLGRVRCEDESIKFNWRITGPRKNEEIDYLYEKRSTLEPVIVRKSCLFGNSKENTTFKNAGDNN